MFAFLLSVLLAAALISPATAQASSVNLWHCSPFGDGYTYPCTTIQNTPSSGVHVLDRSTGTIVTWHDGTSVVLFEWAIDDGTSCGVNNDNYVWLVYWYSGGSTHWGVLGDWWLATGVWSDWSGYTDSWGTLGNSAHYRGHGQGACTYFAPYAGW